MLHQLQKDSDARLILGKTGSTVLCYAKPLICENLWLHRLGALYVINDRENREYRILMKVWSKHHICLVLLVKNGSLKM